jgi:ariadne-1
VRQLLAEEDRGALEKYEHAVVNSYIEDNCNVRWCPSVPSCERAVEALDDGYCELKCPCGLAFCFKCGGPPHSPATCKMWKQWAAKLSDDSETINYLKVSRRPNRAIPD